MIRAGASAVVVAVALAAAPAVAHAFPTGDQFDLDPLTEDGGGGLAFTGSPRSAGHTCAVCHTAAPGKIAIELLAEPAALFTTGYVPDTEYRMRVVIEHEWAASDRRDAGDHCGDMTTPYSRCDDNGFALEIDDDRGYPAGTFAPVVGDHCMAGGPTVDVRVLTDHSAITQGGAHHGVIAWDLCWTAPGADTGPVTAYVAVVDGDGGHATPDDPNTVDGDDVASGAVPIAEHGDQTPPVQSGGCNAGGGSASAGIAIAFAIALALRGRRRRRAALAAALALALAVTGCAHVRAHEKEYLAKRKMVFTPDPTETELDLHMQQSREGSAGGYGSAGGGCGCN